jgi:hypothetical protein
MSALQPRDPGLSRHVSGWTATRLVTIVAALIATIYGAGTSAQTVQKAAPPKGSQAFDVAALKKITDYERARYHPLHFKPAVETATNAQCLACHDEILKRKVRTKSPAGVDAKSALAWYETLDTYNGPQDTFHARHLTTAFSKQVMNLKCNFCHQGNDPRDEAPGSSATTQNSGYTLRKVVDPSDTCLKCHGKFPSQSMGFDTQTWPELRKDMENADAPNGCLTCHAEQFRTVRHQVTYLNADKIEALAKAGSSDSCYGCHGGRAWYRISYPYPRHPWPGMDKETPDWAKGRPTASDARYAIKK